MYKKIKDSFDTGLEKIKWLFTLLSDRVNVELSVIKLLYQSGQMEKQKEDLLRTIGRRVLELKDSPDKQIVKDRVITEAIAEIEQISREIDQTRKKASAAATPGISTRT